jgi:hypothetical protein
VGCLGCGGASLSNGVYQDDQARYRVGTLQSAWDPLEVDGENDLAWGHADIGAVIQVNASCKQDLDVPLEALTQHLLVGFTERRIHEQKLITLDGREALQTHLNAKLEGVDRELLLIVLKKNGCVYDFALVAPPGSAFDRAKADFERFVSHFQTIEAKS